MLALVNKGGKAHFTIRGPSHAKHPADSSLSSDELQIIPFHPSVCSLHMLIAQLHPQTQKSQLHNVSVIIPVKIRVCSDS